MAEPKDFIADHIRAQRWVPSRIVRNGDGGNASVRIRIGSNLQDSIYIAPFGVPAGNELQGEDEVVGVQNVVTKYAQHNLPRKLKK